MHSNEPLSTRLSGDAVDDVAYLLSFANEQSFVFRQGIALVLLAAAGIAEFAPAPHTIDIWDCLAATLTVVAIVILATALREFQTAEKRIRDTHWNGDAT